MKTTKCFMLLLLILSFGLVSGQTEQGRLLLGLSSSVNFSEAGTDLVNVGFSSVRYKSDAAEFVESEADRMTNISLVPKLGYFAADNLAVGIDLTFGLYSEKYGETDNRYTQTLIGAGPFVRYYIPTVGLRPFLEANAVLGSVRYDFDYANSEDDNYNSNFYSLGGGLGLAVPLGEKATVDVLVGYRHFQVKAEEDNEENFRTIMSRTGLRVGFTALLGAGK